MLKFPRRQQFVYVLFGFLVGISTMYIYSTVISNYNELYNGFMFTVTGRIPPKQIPKHSKIENLAVVNDLSKFYAGNNFAKRIAEDVTLLCWILTQAKNLPSKGAAIMNTWGKRCNILLFISSQKDQQFPAVGLDVPEGRSNLWKKTKKAWLYIYTHFRNKAHWFIKADDDTFLVPENLRYFLTQFKTKENYYFGRHFQKYKDYNSGGAGYVFSQGTLRSFLSIANDDKLCPTISEMEDVQIGYCLNSLGIHPHETRDDNVEEIFHPFSPIYHLIPGLIKDSNWLHEFNKWEVKVGSECCAKYSVSFHYIDHNDMYLLDYFIYKFRVFGSTHFTSSESNV